MNENEHVIVFLPTFPDLRTSVEAPGPLPPVVVSFAWAPLPVTVLKLSLTRLSRLSFNVITSRWPFWVRSPWYLYHCCTTE